MIGHLRGPEAGHVAIVDIALDRLAEAGGAARGIDFPARRERERTSHRDVRTLCGRLHRDNVLTHRGDLIVDATRLLVERLQVLHAAFLSANCSRNPGFCTLST